LPKDGGRKRSLPQIRREKLPVRRGFGLWASGRVRPWQRRKSLSRRSLVEKRGAARRPQRRTKKKAG